MERRAGSWGVGEVTMAQVPFSAVPVCALIAGGNSGGGKLEEEEDRTLLAATPPLCLTLQ